MPSMIGSALVARIEQELPMAVAVYVTESELFVSESAPDGGGRRTVHVMLPSPRAGVPLGTAGDRLRLALSRVGALCADVLETHHVRYIPVVEFTPVAPGAPKAVPARPTGLNAGR